MEVLVITKTAFSVLGIVGCGEADKGPEWIRPLWEQAFNRFEEIERFIIPDQGAWGLMSAIDEYLAQWKNEGKYLAGWEVEKDLKAPKGWTVWSVPKQKYAMISCTVGTYGDAYKLFQQFLSKEDYALAGALYEFYPKEFKDVEKDTLFLYFPIQKN